MHHTAHRYQRRGTSRPIAIVPASVHDILLPAGRPFDPTALLERCTYRNLTSPTVLDLGACHILSDYHFFHAEAALARGDRTTALDHLDRMATLGRGIKEIHNNIGSLLAEYGLIDDAIPWFARAAGMDPRYALPRWNLVRICKAAGKMDEVRQRLEELTRATPDDPRHWGELGFLYANTFTDMDQAVYYWQESLRRNPKQPQIIKALYRSR